MNLSTARIELLPITIQHREHLLELDSDPEVMRFISGGRPSTPAQIEAVIQQSLGHRWLGFSAGEFVGWFSLAPGPADGDRELGYRLKRTFWGQGLATEGSKALIDHGFGDLGVARIWAQTMAVNKPSRRVMGRCGLTYVRTFHLEWDDPIDGVEHGEVEYELLAADWAEVKNRK